MRPRRQDLWQKLIEATLASVAERGYAATTVGHITEIAGINRTQFYFLFADKDESFLAAQEAVFAEIEQRIADSGADRAPDWPAKMKLGIEAVLNLFDEQSSLAVVAIVDSQLAGPVAHGNLSEAREKLAPFISEGRSMVPDEQQLPKTVTEMAIGSATALVEYELRGSESPNFGRLAPDIFFAILLPFLGPAEAGRRTGDAYPDSRHVAT